MPMITIQYATPKPNGVAKADIVATVSKLSERLLSNDPNITAMTVQEVAPTDWFVGGRSLAQIGKAAFWVDLRVTDGNKTKDQKAAFIAATFKAFGELLGPLHEECYVHVDDVRGDGYGYGGLTQDRRYIAGKISARAEAA